MRILSLIVCVMLAACASARAPVPPEALASAAPGWLARHDISSVSIAYIADGRVAWAAAFGERAPGAAATPDTLYNVASLAKPVSAEAMLRLASAGRLALDAPMSAHWVDPDLAGAPELDALTLRVALRHQTGFANWRDGVLRFQGPPGQGFTYSGEGFEYARRYAQNALGEPFEQVVQRLVLDPLDMRSTAFTRRDWFEGRIATPHDGDGAPLAPRILSQMNAADDLYTTAHDYARFMLAVMNGEGVSPEIARARYAYAAELRDGGCGEGEGLLPLEVCPLGVGMGMGWMVFRYEGETVISHTGSDDGEQTIAFFVPERGIGVVILTNSAHGRRIFPDIVRTLYPNGDYLALLEMQAG